ncbi:tRNA methyltransferase 10 homolog B [Eublepharis macularius]|uniref:tRNA methyltransferase 10 homolog B n=1 Tax=Eublepharis macularius TaxID=481883 RepID=A0AA97L6I8_EUBMA|nr:tRNA methyltransferase 10 homolog B [Eublepharis macularius]
MAAQRSEARLGGEAARMPSSPGPLPTPARKADGVEGEGEGRARSCAGRRLGAQGSYRARLGMRPQKQREDLTTLGSEIQFLLVEEPSAVHCFVFIHPSGEISLQGHKEMMTYPECETEESACGDRCDRQQDDGLAFQEDGEDLWDAFGLLQIDVGCESIRSQFPGNETGCSRNVLRKQRNWEKIISAKKRKRKHERERRRAKLAEEKDLPPQLSKRHLKGITSERLLRAKETGPRLCVDLSLTTHMTRKEISRLAAQIRRLYGSNKKAQKPFWIYLTGFVKKSPIAEECLRMNDGFSNYIIDVMPESYLDLFPLETIVYLTPDAENALEEVEPHKVYILGGLVDESIQKRLTFQSAKERHLQMARLPIQEYMVKKLNAKNYHSTTLAINQVFVALSTYYETKSWAEALKAAVSPGKGYILRDTTP